MKRPACTLLLMVVACAAAALAQAPAEIVLQVPVKLGGCAVGDVMPGRPGQEIVAVAADGKVHVVSSEGGGWKSEVALQAAGEMIQVAAGDLDPSLPGDEIVAVGMKEGRERREGEGAVHVIRRDGEGWKSEQALVEPRLVHAVCIRPGEAFVAGYAQRVHRIRPSPSGYEVRAIAELPGGGKGAAAAADRIVVACTDGSLMAVVARGEAYDTAVLDKREAGRARVGICGEQAIVSDNGGSLALVGPGGSEVIHREGEWLRGAILMDLDPCHEGLEAATAGYSHRVTILYRTSSGWTPRVLFKDCMRLHHLAAGDVDPASPGIELVACGYSGLLILLRPGASPE